MTEPDRAPSVPSRRRGALLAVGVVVAVLGAMVVLVVVAGGGGGSGEPVELGEVDLDLGAQVYERECAVCHGPSGEGGTGPAVTSSLMVARYPDPADEAAVVRDGVETMPAFGHLDPDELASVVAYTRTALGA